MTTWPVEDTTVGNFHYIGAALTLAEFRQYCIDYKASGQFGSEPPSYVIYHHSYNPDVSWAPTSTNQATWWDRNESGMTLAQKKAKRKLQLDSIMRYYRDEKKWTTGPHLFVDDLFVWLFTPFYYVGIHANEGNSYTKNGKTRYSVGMEVIGNYDKVLWPSLIYNNVGYATACLKAVLGFDLVYTATAQDRPDLHDPQLSGHRDYTTEKSCPGGAISPAFYVQCAKDGWTAYQAQTNPLRAKTLEGASGMVYCSAVAYNFYVINGGFSLFGFPVEDEKQYTLHNGQICTVLKCQRVAIKTSPQFGTELMLIEQEAIPNGIYT